MIARHDPLVDRVRPVMVTLRDWTRETVILGKRQGEQVICLAVVESEQLIRYHTHSGDFKPLHASASGKTLLASLNVEERRKVFEQLRFKAFTSHTIIDIQELEKDLLGGLARGWQQVEGEHVPDVVAIAAPVVINTETHALVVAGPVQRMKDNIDRCTKALVEASRCMEIGIPLGGSRWES